MHIYGLSGKSGTGKSYNAAELCGKMNIQGLIDDGIFVFEGSFVAGVSAKTRNTRLGAVKTAIFHGEEERKTVSAAVREKAPESLLILGTSEDMIRLIASRLELPPPEKIIHIEDITTADQMKKAEESRKLKGMHVIPVPTFQVKKQFSGYFLSAKKSFAGGNGSRKSIEKTLVRPSYSFLGSYEINAKLINDIVNIEVSKIEEICSVIWVVSENTPEGMYVRCIVNAGKITGIMNAALRLQEAVFTMVEHMTAFNVLGVEVEIRGFKKTA